MQIERKRRRDLDDAVSDLLVRRVERSVAGHVPIILVRRHAGYLLERR